MSKIASEWVSINFVTRLGINLIRDVWYMTTMKVKKKKNILHSRDLPLSRSHMAYLLAQSVR